jgi:hypothetical protein
MEWTRSKSGIYRTRDTRFTAFSVPHRKEWVLYDATDTTGRARYYVSLAAAKRGAEDRVKFAAVNA